MTTASLSERGRFMADLLAGLFEHDRDLAEQLNAAQRRVLDANARVPGEIAETIHRAFADYQSLADQRRRLAADVGEAAVRLIDAMRAAGFSEDQARRADVRALRDGIYHPASSASGCSLTDFEPAREHGRRW